MKTIEDEIRHILDYDSEETVALTFETKTRLVKNITALAENYYSAEDLYPDIHVYSETYCGKCNKLL